MSTSLCPRCGAEPVAGMNFCRKCGAPVGVAAENSEQPTAVFDQQVPVETQRLDPRTTRSGYGVPAPVPIGGFAAPIAGHAGRPPGPMRGLVIVGVFLVLLLGLGAVMVKYVMKPRVHTKTATNKQGAHPDHKALTYPGARTMMDVTAPSGAGVLQLQTNDDLDKVADWYLVQLKGAQTVRVGPMVIFKTDKMTATIVSDSGSTNIMIKLTP